MNIPQKEANRKPFKMISVSDLRRLTLELPLPALKVWLCHFSHSGADGTSALSLDTLATETNLEIKAVKRARAWLRKYGWLITTGQKRGTRGKFSVPIERATFGTVGTKRAYRHRGDKKGPRHAGTNSPSEVVFLESKPEVDTATPKPQPVIVFQNENPEAKIRRLKRTLRNSKLVPAERERITETLRKLENPSRESEPAPEAAQNGA